MKTVKAGQQSLLQGAVSPIIESAYCQLCGAWRGELGSEPTLDLFVEHLTEVLREVRRVLKPTGVCLIELGDTYSGAGRSNNSLRAGIVGGKADCEHDFFVRQRHPPICGKCGALKINSGTNGRKHDNGGKPRYTPDQALGEKQLSLVPFRVALAMQADGWTLRSWWPWIRRNPMPESTTDRPSNGLSVWLMFVKQARGYFWDSESVRRSALQPLGEPVRTGQHKSTILGHNSNTSTLGSNQGSAGRAYRNTDPYFDSLDAEIELRRAELARLEALRASGGVLEDAGQILALDVPTSGYAGAHYATFPERLIVPLVRAGSSERGVCAECGAPWRRVVEREFVPQDDVSLVKGVKGHGTQKPMYADNGWQGVPRGTTRTTTVDWQPSCTCNGHFEEVEVERPEDDHALIAPKKSTISFYVPHIPLQEHPALPAVVLDPFCGSGTTLAVALKHGRRAIGMDLSAAYLGEHARPRLENDAEVRQVRAYAGHDTTPRAAGTLDDLPLFKLPTEAA